MNFTEFLNKIEEDTMRDKCPRCGVDATLYPSDKEDYICEVCLDKEEDEDNCEGFQAI